MPILTKLRLSTLTETKLGVRTFSEVLNESKNENKYLADITIFLSHSHEDLKDGTVNKAIVFLRKLGIRVYIDSQDSSLPPFTSAETATTIKKRIRDNKKFIFLATEKSILSRWCNWELGYGDHDKYINHIAILPIAETNTNFSGTEYLRIYPRIEESNYTPEYYKIIFPDGRELSIAEWFKL